MTTIQPARIAVLKERRADERRVAITPDMVKRFVGLGCSVQVEAGAGLGASIDDASYQAAGATIGPSPAAALAGADLVFAVRAPMGEVLDALPVGGTLVGLLEPFQSPLLLMALAARRVRAFAMELVPRTTRAQVMDALSSQANLAGYRAVIEAAHAYGKAFPMMTTAAGTITPARVFVMGAGVAGLQAIATARRLGAVVSATDVRPAAKEQVESLGAKFVAVEDDEFRSAETAGGYAKEMSAEYRAKQAALVTEHLRKQDIVITTAQVPGKAAPILLTRAQVASLKPGSVVVDLGIEQGGNVEGSELGAAVETPNGAKVLGYANLPSRVAANASDLYARNVHAFAQLLLDKSGALLAESDDDILAASLITRDGAVVHPLLARELAPRSEETA